MNEISKEIFEKYQIRKTRAQKAAFIEYIKEKFPEAVVEEGGIGRNRNIVIGDVSSADVVFGAHYDTCAVMPFPNFLTPKNLFIYFLYSFIVFGVPMFAAMILTQVVLISLGASAAAAYWCGMAAIFGILLLVVIGPENKHTANDNTSGVIDLCEIYSALTECQRQRTAFVFFDNEEKGLFGSLFFNKTHKADMKNKLLINFDCVSDGDNIMCVFNKTAEDRYFSKIKGAFNIETDKTVLLEKERSAFYPSDQKNFPCAVGVASFKNGPFGLYMDKIHTPKDINFDEKNIELIANAMVNLMDNI